jgi:hypothetical protein
MTSFWSWNYSCSIRNTVHFYTCFFAPGLFGPLCVGISFVQTQLKEMIQFNLMMELTVMRLNCFHWVSIVLTSKAFLFLLPHNGGEGMS